MNKNLPEIVVIGASAGGLEAVSRIVEMLPADYPIPILFVSHLMKGRQSEAASILQQRTALNVRPVEDGDRLKPPGLYVAAWARNIVVTRQGLSIVEGDQSTRLSPSINVALESAATAYRERLLAILLTGMLDDGVEGLQAVFKTGGTALVQDPEEAAYASMPRAAIARDHPDRVLKLEQIGKHLLGLVDR
jgi:two-component system chemotaxis response regulator CheB